MHDDETAISFASRQAFANCVPSLAAISGPYQGVLEWAHKAESGSTFFARFTLKGVASDQMRSFAKAFQNHIVTFGVADDDETVWANIRRFIILEFDFESGAPQAKANALTLARLVLASNDATQAEALWGNLIALIIEIGQAGRAITRQ